MSTFASNINRLQQVVDAAILTNRKLLLLGRSMVNVVMIALELGYINIPDGMLIEAKEANALPREQVAILCTGSQGEPMAALSRLASSTYPHTEIIAGDTVILASSPIPGNERNVANMLDHLYLLGANVVHGSGVASGMHVSGHGSQEELKLMITLMKPKFFIPIHGEYRMLYQHRQLAQSVGVESNNIYILNNGDILDIENGCVEQNRKVTAGNTLVDGLGIGDIGTVVLRDRKHLAEDGILVVVITLSRVEGTILSGPDIISRGFVHVRESEALLKEVSRLVVKTIAELQENGNDGKWSALKHKTKETVSKFVYAKTKRRPMILPIIIEV